MCVSIVATSVLGQVFLSRPRIRQERGNCDVGKLHADRLVLCVVGGLPRRGAGCRHRLAALLTDGRAAAAGEEVQPAEAGAHCPALGTHPADAARAEAVAALAGSRLQREAGPAVVLGGRGGGIDGTNDRECASKGHDENVSSAKTSAAQTHTKKKRPPGRASGRLPGRALSQCIWSPGRVPAAPVHPVPALSR